VVMQTALDAAQPGAAGRIGTAATLVGVTPIFSIPPPFVAPSYRISIHTRSALACLDTLASSSLTAK